MTTKLHSTPGPWMADIRGACLAVYPVNREDDSPGISCSHDRNIHFSSKGAKYDGDRFSMDEEARANAHLIAAAPDLYEALLELADAVYKNVPDDKLMPLLKGYGMAQRALVKARGEQP